jgi:hypothetical protein
MLPRVLLYFYVVIMGFLFLLERPMELAIGP